jgi:hypothetical protein
MTKTNVNAMDMAVLSLEQYYASLTAPTGHDWPMPTVLLALGLSDFNYTAKNPRVPQLTACILLALPLGRREQLMSIYSVNSAVSDLLAQWGDAPIWPEPLELPDYETTTSDDLDTLKERRTLALQTIVNLLAGSVIQTSPRELMQQMWTALSATAVLNGLYAGTEPTVEEFPLLEASRVFRGLDTLDEAADAIMLKARGWALADATLQGYVFDGSEAIALAEDAQAVQDAYDDALALARGLVAALATAAP